MILDITTTRELDNLLELYDNNIPNALDYFKLIYFYRFSVIRPKEEVCVVFEDIEGYRERAYRIINRWRDSYCDNLLKMYWVARVLEKLAIFFSLLIFLNDTSLWYMPVLTTTLLWLTSPFKGAIKGTSLMTLWKLGQYTYHTSYLLFGFGIFKISMRYRFSIPFTYDWFSSLADLIIVMEQCLNEEVDGH